MNKDKVKGEMDDAIGRVKRQSGEWTGDVDKQVKGAGQQIKGKAEKVWGNIKDATHNPSSHKPEDRDDLDRKTGSTSTEQHHHQR